MKNFRVSDLISLRLENERTFIYINGEKFIQCKSLLLNLPVNKIDELSNIKSIDELDKSSEDQKIVEFKISPETEFWGHCSNLQAWAENNYDTRLLHSNLAFPLLKKLTEIGDPKAKTIIKQEIIKRLEEGYTPVAQFLQATGYLDYISQEQLLPILLSWADPVFEHIILNKYDDFKDREKVLNIILLRKEAKCILDLERILKIKLLLSSNQETPQSFYIRNKHVIRLNLENLDLEFLPQEISNLSHLESLDLSNNSFTHLPSSVTRLTHLRTLNFALNRIGYKTRDEIVEKYPQYEVSFSSNELSKVIKIFGGFAKYFKTIESIKTQDITELLNLNSNFLDKLIKFNFKELGETGLTLKLQNGIIYNQTNICFRE